VGTLAKEVVAMGAVVMESAVKALVVVMKTMWLCPVDHQHF